MSSILHLACNSTYQLTLISQPVIIGYLQQGSDESVPVLYETFLCQVALVAKRAFGVKDLLELPAEWLKLQLLALCSVSVVKKH